MEVDYEKSYDMVNRNFLEGTLTCRGFFANKLVNRVNSFLYNSTLNIRVNDETRPRIIASKGLNKVTQCLMFFLILLGRMFFSRMLDKAARSNIIYGLLPTVSPCGIISLEYAHDTILFFKDKKCSARLLKLLLLSRRREFRSVGRVPPFSRHL